ncbi:hypothetical protein SXCC_03763 [Gluconacetobacter sp. SXCC-1]|nr:hypothetical protein SXCC_03763 [Gluconacetobacter sp. SXCC-1]
MTGHIVMQRTAFLHRNADHGALGAVGRLADRLGNFTGLARAEPYAPLLVTNHNQCRECKAATALYNLGNTIDRDQLVDQIIAFAVAIATTPAAFSRFTCHYA